MSYPRIGSSKHNRLLFLIEAAVQAPSSHNTQPWKFRIQGHTILVFADPARALKVGDRHSWELYASVGAAIANLLSAAQALNLQTDVSYFPSKKDPSLIAEVVVTFSQTSHKIVTKPLENIWNRRTNRTPYIKSKFIPQSLQQTLLKIAERNDVTLHLIQDSTQIERIGKMVSAGLIEFLRRKDFREELSGWIRHDWSKQGDGLPGYSLGMPGIVSLLAPLFIKSTAHIDEVAEGERQAVVSCNTVGVITIPRDLPIYWVKTGLTYEQIALHLHDHGYASAILTSIIESSTQRRQLTKMVGAKPSLFFRLGKPSGAGVSVPRRPASQVI